jgi:hypothetical protein
VEQFSQEFPAQLVGRAIYRRGGQSDLEGVVLYAAKLVFGGTWLDVQLSTMPLSTTLLIEFSGRLIT